MVQQINTVFEQTRGKWIAGALFVRELTMAVVTSVMVRVWNADSEQPAGAGVNVDGEASAVVARTAAILSSTKRCQSLALIAADFGARPQPINTSTDCHS